jgi:hypothetical protein
VELIFAVTAAWEIAMVIVRTTLSGVKTATMKTAAGEILHLYSVNYAACNIVNIVLNPMRMVLGYAKVVKHVFVVNAEWKSVTS